MKVKAKVDRAYVIDEAGRSIRKKPGDVFDITDEKVAEQYVSQGFVSRVKEESKKKDKKGKGK